MKKFPSHIFRGYDLRGVVGVDLSPEFMELLGKAYGTFLYQRRINETIVGRDNRLTSEEYSQAFIQGLRKMGINVIDIGLSLVHIMYFAQYHYLSKGGAYISASHNPKEFNGLKLAVGFSDTMVDEVQEYKKIAESGKFKGYDKIGSYKKEDVFKYYLADLRKRIPEKYNFKIVLDGSCTTPSIFVPQILRTYGCQVIEQNTKLDGNFPAGTPDPTEKSILERLGKRVVIEKADLGLTYDADGDRMGIVDQDGTPIWNDVILAIYAKDILEYLPGSKLIINVLCSKASSDTILSCGGKPIIWLVGHSYIKAKIKEERCPFGGELSGHFFFMDNFYGHDDGIYSTLRILSYLHRKNKSLKQVVATIPQYISSPEIKLGLADDIKFQFIKEKIGNDIKKLYPKADYIEIDGVRMDAKETMAIIRASQNGPYITIKFEGKTPEQYDQLKVQLREILKKYPEINWAKGVNTDAFD